MRACLWSADAFLYLAVLKFFSPSVAASKSSSIPELSSRVAAASGEFWKEYSRRFCQWGFPVSWNAQRLKRRGARNRKRTLLGVHRRRVTRFTSSSQIMWKCLQFLLGENKTRDFYGLSYNRSVLIGAHLRFEPPQEVGAVPGFLFAAGTFSRNQSTFNPGISWFKFLYRSLILWY